MSQEYLEEKVQAPQEVIVEKMAEDEEKKEKIFSELPHEFKRSILKRGDFEADQVDQYSRIAQNFEGYLSHYDQQIRVPEDGKISQVGARTFVSKVFRENVYGEEWRKMIRLGNLGKELLTGKKPFDPKEVDFYVKNNALDREAAYDESVRAELDWARRFVTEYLPNRMIAATGFADLKRSAQLALFSRGEAVSEEAVGREIRAKLKKHLDAFTFLKGFEETRRETLDDPESRSVWLDKALQRFGFEFDKETGGYVDTTDDRERELGGDGLSYKEGKDLPQKLIQEAVLADKAASEERIKNELRSSLQNEVVAGEEESVALLEAERHTLQLQRDEAERKRDEIAAKLKGAGGFFRGLFNPDLSKSQEVAQQTLAQLTERLASVVQQIESKK